MGYGNNIVTKTAEQAQTGSIVKRTATRRYFNRGRNIASGAFVIGSNANTRKLPEQELPGMDHKRKLSPGQRYSKQGYGVRIWPVGGNRTEFNIAAHQGVAGKRARIRQKAGATIFRTIQETKIITQCEKDKKLAWCRHDPIQNRKTDVRFTVNCVPLYKSHGVGCMIAKKQPHKRGWCLFNAFACSFA